MLTPSVHAVPTLCPQLKCGAPNSLLTPSLGLPKPALVFVTVLSFQEESAGAYSCGWYLNRDSSLAQQDISVSRAMRTDLFCLVSMEGDWPCLEPASSLASQPERSAGLQQ